MSSKRRRKKARVPGLIITIILLLLVAEFVGLLAITKLLPVYLLFAVGIVFMTCVLLVAMLTGNFRKKVRFIIGAILDVLLLAILLLGNLYVMSTYNTLNKISGVNTQTSQIGVYVLKDDSAQSIEDAKSYTFGTLSNLDTENTQAAVKQIEERTGQSVKTQEENGVTKLVDSLLDGSCDAIILNHAYLPVLEDMEGYADIEDKIRELDLLSVDVEIKTDDTASSDDTAKQTDPDNIIRLYISGIDTRGSEIINTRSDVNIIATINTDTKQMLLVSTPRDYFVPLSISNGVPDKLTHAGIYGIDVSMDTLGMLYDISLDDYFYNREDTPRNPDGSYDFESLRAIDVPLFNQQIDDLNQGKDVHLARFEFVEGKRYFDEKPTRLEPGQPIVVEGLHALNDSLTYMLPRYEKVKISLGVLTQIRINDHNRISTSDTRIIRRMVRDHQFRGRGPEATMEIWGDVRRGEEKNIYPYQEDADTIFNTALPYELAVLKPYAEPLLESIGQDSPYYAEAQRLVKFLKPFKPVDSSVVPMNSLLREFIGK